MNKLTFDREQLLEVWNTSFERVKMLGTLNQQHTLEYAYHSGVVDVCKLLFGEKELQHDK